MTKKKDTHLANIEGDVDWVGICGIVLKIIYPLMIQHHPGRELTFLIYISFIDRAKQLRLQTRRKPINV